MDISKFLKDDRWSGLKIMMGALVTGMIGVAIGGIIHHMTGYTIVVASWLAAVFGLAVHYRHFFKK